MPNHSKPKPKKNCPSLDNNSKYLLAPLCKTFILPWKGAVQVCSIYFVPLPTTSFPGDRSSYPPPLPGDSTLQVTNLPLPPLPYVVTEPCSWKTYHYLLSLTWWQNPASDKPTVTSPPLPGDRTLQVTNLLLPPLPYLMTEPCTWQTYRYLPSLAWWQNPASEKPTVASPPLPGDRALQVTNLPLPPLPYLVTAPCWSFLAWPG